MVPSASVTFITVNSAGDDLEGLAAMECEAVTRVRGQQLQESAPFITSLMKCLTYASLSLLEARCELGTEVQNKRCSSCRNAETEGNLAHIPCHGKRTLRWRVEVTFHQNQMSWRYTS